MNEGLASSIKEAVSAMKRAKKISIVAHVNPDGDTIGCLLALGLALILKGKKVSLLSQDGVPTRFGFLPGSELILSETKEKSDVAIAVDCGSIERIGKLKNIFVKSKTTIQIDHHDFGESFGDIQVVDEEASAVGEIIFDVIQSLGVEITPAIATCLLTSIIVDTGAFRFSNVRPKTFEILSQLIKTGVNLTRLIEDTYWKRNRQTARLCAYSIWRAEFSKSGKVAWAAVSQKDFERFSAELSDVDNVADDLRAIEGVRIAAVFRETPKRRLRVSLRSSYGTNVALVAKKFKGGGHHNSAGCVIDSKRDKQKLLNELELLVS